MNFSEHGGPSNQNRAIGLVAVVAFHALLIWGLANGLAQKAMELLPSPIETKIIEEIKPPPEAPPPPEPDFKPPPPDYLPPPDIVLANPPPADNAPRQIVNTPPVAPPAPAAPPAPVRIAPKLDLPGSPRACREPEYPAASERLGESGQTAIALLIGPDGAVQQTRIDESSGYKRLDDATIKAFSRCKFVVGTTNGVPEASWFRMKYRWVVPQ